MSIKKSIAKSAEGYPLLGHCIYWSINKFEASISELANALKQADIDPSLAKEPRAKTALTKAMKEMAKGRKGAFHRKAIDSEEKATFVVVSSKVDYKKDDVKFKTGTKATLDKSSHALNVEGDDAEVIREKYDEFKTKYTSDQFVAMVKRYIFTHCNAITVRDSGGVYFIPSTHNEELKKLRELFSSFPNATSMDVIPIIDTKEAKKSMWKALVGKVDRDIMDMKEELENLPRDPRAGVIEARLEKYKSLRDKVDSYENLLSHTAKDLKDKIEEIGSIIKRRLSE